MLVVICISPWLVPFFGKSTSFSPIAGDKETVLRRFHTVLVGNRGGRDDALEQEAGERKAFTGAEKERPETYPRYEPTDLT